MPDVGESAVSHLSGQEWKDALTDLRAKPAAGSETWERDTELDAAIRLGRDRHVLTEAKR